MDWGLLHLQALLLGAALAAGIILVWVRRRQPPPAEPVIPELPPISQEAMAAHLTKTIIRLRHLYDRDFGIHTPPPHTLQDGKDIQHLAMAAALHVLNSERLAAQEELSADQTWEQVSGKLQAVLGHLQLVQEIKSGKPVPVLQEPVATSAPAAGEESRVVVTPADVEKYESKINQLQAALEEKSKQQQRAEAELGRLRGMVDELNQLKQDIGRRQEDGSHIYQEIITILKEVKGAEALADMVKRYRAVFEGLGHAAYQGEGAKAGKSNVDAKLALIDSLQKSFNEIKMMREKMATQGETIAKLKARLDEVLKASPDEKARKEIEQLQRVLAETEGCIHTLEQELDTTHENMRQMAGELETLRRERRYGSDDEQLQLLKREKHELQSCINVLERDADIRTHEVDRLNKDLGERKREIVRLKEELLDYKKYGASNSR